MILQEKVIIEGNISWITCVPLIRDWDPSKSNIYLTIL